MPLSKLWIYNYNSDYCTLNIYVYLSWVYAGIYLSKYTNMYK